MVSINRSYFIGYPNRASPEDKLRKQDTSAILVDCTNNCRHNCEKTGVGYEKSTLALIWKQLSGLRNTHLMTSYVPTSLHLQNKN